MTKQEAGYKAVEAYRKKHPNEKLNAIFKKLKVQSTVYYKQRVKVLGKAKRGYDRQTVQDAVAAPGNVTVIMGTPEQIRAVLQ